jgi:hypothetical protein
LFPCESKLESPALVASSDKVLLITVLEVTWYLLKRGYIGQDEGNIEWLVNGPHYRKLVDKNGVDDWYLTYNWAGDLLTVKFQPQHICMLPESGACFILYIKCAHRDLCCFKVSVYL